MVKKQTRLSEHSRNLIDDVSMDFGSPPIDVTIREVITNYRRLKAENELKDLKLKIQVEKTEAVESENARIKERLGELEEKLKKYEVVE